MDVAFRKMNRPGQTLKDIEHGILNKLLVDTQEIYQMYHHTVLFPEFKIQRIVRRINMQKEITIERSSNAI